MNGYIDAFFLLVSFNFVKKTWAWIRGTCRPPLHAQPVVQTAGASAAYGRVR